VRKLASVQKIAGIYPIEDADRIELAQVNDWYVIVKKGEFKVDDFVVYIEIDSLLPSDNPAFDFMEKYKYRVKTIRMRGIYSQGLIMPFSIIDTPESNLMESGIQVGDDVTELLHITKYEPPETFDSSGHQSQWNNSTPKTDEERIQNLGSKYTFLQSIDDEWVQSVKLDGTSVSYQLIDGEFRVFSHNCELKDGQGSIWEWAIENDVESKMRKYCKSHGIPEDIALQGEMVGPGIQQNRQNYETKTVKFFYIFNRSTQRYFEYQEFTEAIKSEMEFDTVPILDAHFRISNYSVKDLLDMADEYDKNSTTRQEGFVFYARNNYYDLYNKPRSNPMGRVSFKVKSNKYVLDFESR